MGSKEKNEEDISSYRDTVPILYSKVPHLCNNVIKFKSTLINVKSIIIIFRMYLETKVTIFSLLFSCLFWSVFVFLFFPKGNNVFIIVFNFSPPFFAATLGRPFSLPQPCSLPFLQANKILLSLWFRSHSMIFYFPRFY